MRREHALEKIRRVEPILRESGVAAAALFGSVARAEEDENSDIDIAVRPSAGASIGPLTLLRLYGVLGEEFGYDTLIDVVVLPTRSPELARSIDRDIVFAFS